jgi:phosphopantetheine adenylyltransferase
VNQVSLALSIVGGVLLLIGVAAALTAVYRTTASDKILARLRGENVDYVRRLEYVEPRLHTLEQQNETLLRLHDPSTDRAATKAEHAEIIRILNEQTRVLGEIESGMEGRQR